MTDTRNEFHELFGELYLPVLLAVGALVSLVVLVAAVRYRRRPGRPPSARSDRPVLESIYVAVIAVVVAVFVWATFTAEARVDRVASNPRLRVDVTAFKWQWRFDYPELGIPPSIGTDARRAELVVPSNATVRFRMTSRDVIHALWIPAVRFKRDAFPKRETNFDLVFDKPGVYPGRCAEFCGLDHARMTLDVRVLRPAAFDAWVASRRA